MAQCREVLRQNNCLFRLLYDLFSQLRRSFEALMRVGQRDNECAAAFVGVTQFKAPVMRFRDPASDGKAKPRASISAYSGDERI